MRRSQATRPAKRRVAVPVASDRFSLRPDRVSTASAAGFPGLPAGTAEGPVQAAADVAQVQDGIDVDDHLRQREPGDDAPVALESGVQEVGHQQNGYPKVRGFAGLGPQANLEEILALRVEVHGGIEVAQRGLAKEAAKAENAEPGVDGAVSFPGAQGTQRARQS